MTVRAIFEDGVFKPTEAIDLPEKSQVEVEFRLLVGDAADEAAQDRIYRLLGQSVASGESNVAERHNEHQP